MPTLKIALPTKLISRSLKQAIPAISQMGATGIQLDVVNEVSDLSSKTGLKHFLNLLSQFDLEIGTVYLPLTRPLTDQEALESQIAMIRNGISLASQLKTKVMTTYLGPIPDSETEDYNTLVEVLNDLVHHSNHFGVTLAVTPMNESPVKYLDFLKKINRGPIGLNYDPAAVYTAGYSPTEEYQSVYQSVSHVVVRNSVRQLDGAGQEVPYGDGDVAWDEMFALLHEGSYQGWMTVMRTQGTTIQSDLEKTIQLIKMQTLNFWQ